MLEKLKEQLKRHEGYRQHVYLDTVGKMTCGYGRNLSDVGISQPEAEYLLENDIAKAYDGLRENLSWFDDLDGARQGVLLNMAFNMGVAGLLEFHQTLANVRSGDYRMAASCMKQSKWYGQVKNRGKELVRQMETGQWQ